MSSVPVNSISQFGRAYSFDVFELRIGRRRLCLTQDVRNRFDRGLIRCSAGVQRGHLEISLFGRWVLVMSRAR